jgi:hypothetical protein
MLLIQPLYGGYSMLQAFVFSFIALAVGCGTSASSSSGSERDASVPDEPAHDAGATDSAIEGVPDASDASPDAALDAGADAALVAGDAGFIACGSGDDIRTGSRCAENVGGVFAIKTVLDVWWQDDVHPGFVDAGRGYVTVFQKATVADACDDGTMEGVQLQACGLTLPTLSSWVYCKAYQMAVPDRVWDEPTMPVWVTTGSVSSFDLGGVMTLGNINALIGINLDEEGGDWPPFVAEVMCGAASSKPEACFVHHDGDGVLGVPFSMINLGTNYRETGCSLGGSQPVRFDSFRTDALAIACDEDCTRAVTLHMGARTSHATRAAFSSCAADDAQLSGHSSAGAVEMRAIGCETNEGEPCDRYEVEFVDSMLPTYNVLAAGAAPPTTVEANACDCPAGCSGEACELEQTPSVGPRAGMVWLGEDSGSFDCAAIRSAVEAAYPGVEF